MGSEILRRGCVGIRLTFFGRFGVLTFDGRGLSCFVMILGKLALDGVRVLLRIVRLLGRMSVSVMELLVVRFFVMLSGPS